MFFSTKMVMKTIKFTSSACPKVVRDQTRSTTPCGLVCSKRLCAKGGTTLNQLPIGLHVKILNFNVRFEAYWATFGVLSCYKLIQNRRKFNADFNVWVVVGIVFAVRARKQRPPCF